MEKINEIWKPVPGFKSCYEVSNLGNARVVRGGIPRPKKISKLRGYGIIAMSKKDGSHTSMTMQRAVYMAFCGPIPDGMEVDHIDNNNENNAIENLRLVTRQENMGKSWELRRASGRRAMHQLGDHCKRGHAYDEENTWYARTGHRYCRACMRMKASERYQRSKKAANG